MFGLLVASVANLKSKHIFAIRDFEVCVWVVEEYSDGMGDGKKVIVRKR